MPVTVMSILECLYRHYRVFCLTGMSMDRLPIAIFYVIKPVSLVDRYPPFLLDPLATH